MTYAIKAQGLAKLYKIGARKQNASYATLRDSISNALRKPFGGGADMSTTDLWALNDVSFDIGFGEVVGIIGRNGAGKSTLLKVLSRITDPTRGQAQLFGRVASLLEVGTGFHPELTGRENVYLNGAILGMRKAEIDRNFDEIVAFAEIERFIDTPVKFYSSGMYVRLAFAVAAHLDPEILIVDEVLAVGDARFQKKCLAKMQSVGQQGRTVLFVSHSMQAIMRMCDRTILLDSGRVLADGPSQTVIASYLGKENGSMGRREWPDPARAPGAEYARLRSVRVLDQDGEIAESVEIRSPLTIEMEFEALKGGAILMPHLYFTNDDNVRLFTSIDVDPQWRRTPRPAGRYVSRVQIPGNLLAEGTVYVTAAMTTLEPQIRQFYEPDAVAFQIVDRMEDGGARGDWHGNVEGVVRPLLEWTTTHTAG